MELKTLFDGYGSDKGFDTHMLHHAYAHQHGQSVLGRHSSPSRFLRQALLALGCAPHSGRAALPLSAQWEAAARVSASVKVSDSKALTIQAHIIETLGGRGAPLRLLEVGLGTRTKGIVSAMAPWNKPAGGSVRTFRDFLPNAQVSPLVVVGGSGVHLGELTRLARLSRPFFG